jgi:predicted ArsR family transcriptional regulator
VTRTTSRAVAQQGTTLHRALSDPSRVRILELVQQAKTPLDARELATRVGLHVNSVRLHLRVLAEAGLVSEQREQPTRPGRPRLLYQATTAEALDPAALASYRLLAQILASQLAGSEPNPAARAEQAGRAWGAHLVRKPPPNTTTSKQQTIAELLRLHQQHGFTAEARQTPRGREIVLKHCPIQQAATTYQTVICPIHLGLIRGALAELDTGIQADSLQPFAEPGACISHLSGA